MTKAELIEFISKLTITNFDVQSITASCDDPTIVGLMIVDASIATEEEVANC